MSGPSCAVCASPRHLGDGQPAPDPRTDFLPVEYFDDDCDLGDDDDWMDECGYVPGSGVCTLAGTEHCDWECPYNPCDPEGT